MYLFFLLLGLGFLSVGIVTLNEFRDAIKLGYHAKGKIIDIKKKRGRRHRDVCAVVEFIDQNQTNRFNKPRFGLVDLAFILKENLLQLVIIKALFMKWIAQST